MFESSIEIRSFVEGIQRTKLANDDREFHKAVFALSKYMKQQQMSPTTWQKLDQIAFYEMDDFSEEQTTANRQKAKESVVTYITELLNGDSNDTILYRVLENFYEYVEALLERKPHQKSNISKSLTNHIVINNEYDVQFLLFAYLKPLFPKERAEVSDDTGYETVRTDILIDQNTCIEAKCSRDSMSEKKLGEEIKADMVQYKQKNIYFFIYDKSKIIKNPLLFKEEYEKMEPNKNIYIIIHQPKKL